MVEVTHMFLQCTVCMIEKKRIKEVQTEKKQTLQACHSIVRSGFMYQIVPPLHKQH